MHRSDEFEGDNAIDTSADHANAVRISSKLVSMYDELVTEGADLDIASVFVKIAGYPPQVLRTLRKALENYLGLDSLSNFRFPRSASFPSVSRTLLSRLLPKETTMRLVQPLCRPA